MNVVRSIGVSGTIEYKKSCLFSLDRHDSWYCIIIPEGVKSGFWRERGMLCLL